MEKMLSASQLAKMLGKHRHTINNYRRRGMPAMAVGNWYYYQLSDVEKWLDEQKEKIKPIELEQRDQ